MLLTCTKCGEARSPDGFYKRKGRIRRPCKTCEKASVATWRASNSDRRNASIAAYNEANPGAHKRTLRLMRERNLAKWGLTIADYDAILAAQGGRCAICATDVPGAGHGNFDVDHDHTCCPNQKSCGDCIRGLLCVACNRGLGLLKDDAAVLRAAADYLEKT